jgi:regulator of protease activity HflC (stomatin/prohibitin superfamily)
VERFGEYQKVLKPGLSFVGCDCCGICYSFRSISKRVQQNDCIIDTKSKDNVMVQIKCAVQQSVDPVHAEEAIYKLEDVNAQVDAYVADVVRSHLPQMTLDEAFEKKDTISDAIKDQLDQQMKNYGFNIHKALVTEVVPSQQVMDAMNEINKQKRLRDAAIMAGEAEKVRTVKAAEAAAESAFLQGEGIARQRAAIVNGLRKSINEEGEGGSLSNERISELLLMTQYFETLRDIGANSKATTVFLPQSPSDSLADIAGQIRNGVLQGGAASAAPA